MRFHVRRLLRASDYCQARGNQIVEQSSDDETVEGAAKHLIDGREKHICRLSFDFRVRMVLKGAVKPKALALVECCYGMNLSYFFMSIRVESDNH